MSCRSLGVAASGERPLVLGDLLVETSPGDTEDLEPVALPWRGGRTGDREPELVLPGSLLSRGLVLGGPPSTISAPDSAVLVSN